MKRLFTEHGVEIKLDASGRPLPDNASQYIGYKSALHNPAWFSGASMSQQDHQDEAESMQFGCCSKCDDHVTKDELDGNGGLCAFCCVRAVQNGTA